MHRLADSDTVICRLICSAMQRTYQIEVVSLRTQTIDQIDGLLTVVNVSIIRDEKIKYNVYTAQKRN